MLKLNMSLTCTLERSCYYITRKKWKAIVMGIIILTTLINITTNGMAFAHKHHHFNFQDDSKSPTDKKSNLHLCYIVGIYYCLALFHMH
jgi:hypothetical protein